MLLWLDPAQEHGPEVAEQAARARGAGSRGSEARKARPLGEVSGGHEAGSEGGEVRATTDLRPRDQSSSRWQGARSPRTLSSHVTLPHGLPARPWPQEGRPGHFCHGLSPHTALLQGHTGSEAMHSPEQGARRDGPAIGSRPDDPRNPQASSASLVPAQTRRPCLPISSTACLR